MAPFKTIGHAITSADIRSYFDRQSIGYLDFHQPSSLDITKCFDDASDEGNLLLDFITHVADFRGTVPGDLQRAVLERLASSDISEKKDGEILLSNDWDAFYIYKPTESN